jgi:hypothetical protein
MLQLTSYNEKKRFSGSGKPLFWHIARIVERFAAGLDILQLTEVVG